MPYNAQKKLEDLGIKLITTNKEFREKFDLRHSLLCGTCSKTKIKKEGEFYPQELYRSVQNQVLALRCKMWFLIFGIISDFYGITFSDRKYKTYDLHPSLVTEEGFKELGVKAWKELQARGVRKVFIFGLCVKRIVPYLKILSYGKQWSDQEIYCFTKIDIVDFSNNLLEELK